MALVKNKSNIIVRLLTMGCMVLCSYFSFAKMPTDATAPQKFSISSELKQKADAIFDSLRLDTCNLEREIFYKAYKGYAYFLQKALLQNVNYITIADMSQSSRNKRLYVIDLAHMKLTYHTYVSHGKNSGGEMATSFSNLNDSFKSTLGFLITADTYSGAAGYSLRFTGMEPGINDLVRYRNIIVHGSRYVNENKALKEGQVGNSLGCPAVPYAQSRKMIDLIKGGSMYFIYSPDENYNATSAILNAPITQQVNTVQASANAVILPQPNMTSPLLDGKNN